MAKKTSKDVLTLGEKQERLLYIKVLRAWGEVNHLGQFNIALKLLSTFYRAFGVQFNFIRDKGLQDDFEKYFVDLEGDFEKVFEILNEFTEQIEHKIVPIFGR